MIRYCTVALLHKGVCRAQALGSQVKYGLTIPADIVELRLSEANVIRVANAPRLHTAAGSWTLSLSTRLTSNVIAMRTAEVTIVML